MKYLNCSSLVKNLQEKEAGVFEGYASVFGAVDQQNESVAKGAFQETLAQWRQQERWPKMLWQHEPQTPIGLWETMQEDDYGLFVRGRLLLDLQRGREAYTLLKSGIVDGLSIGYFAKRSHKEGNVCVLDKIDLYEVSLVTFMANPYAKVTSCKKWSEPYATDPPLLARLHNLKKAMDRTDAKVRALLRGGW